MAWRPTAPGQANTWTGDDQVSWICEIVLARHCNEIILSNLASSAVWDRLLHCGLVVPYGLLDLDLHQVMSWRLHGAEPLLKFLMIYRWWEQIWGNQTIEISIHEHSFENSRQCDVEDFGRIFNGLKYETPWIPLTKLLELDRFLGHLRTILIWAGDFDKNKLNQYQRFKQTSFIP